MQAELANVKVVYVSERLAEVQAKVAQAKGGLRAYLLECRLGPVEKLVLCYSSENLPTVVDCPIKFP